MTDAVLTLPAAEGDFSIGRVFNRTFALLGRNFLMFSLVMAVATAPTVALTAFGATDPANSARIAIVALISTFLAGVLGTLAQAVVVHGSFQDMRRRPVDLMESLKVGFSRFLPVLGLAILVMLGVWLGCLLLFIPGLMLLTRWYLAAPACVVERLGPRDSMRRSAQLTEGHRWKVFGGIVLLVIGSTIASQTITASFTVMGGAMLGLVGTLISGAISGAVTAIFVVVAYYELRVAKEGIDIDEIAAVFD